MPTYIATGINSVQTTELADIPGSSVNVQVQNDNAFDQIPVPVSYSNALYFINSNHYSLVAYYQSKTNESPLSLLYGDVYGVNLATSQVDYGQDGFSIDLGNISGIKEVKFGVWNAFEYAIEITSITITPSQGLQIVDPSIGLVLDPRQEIVSTLRVNTNIPPLVDAVITFGFDNGASVSIDVVGLAGHLVPDRPQATILEKISFKTDVMVSRNGKEHRTALRSIPRQSFGIKYEFSPDRNAKEVQNKIESLCGGSYLFPVWTEQRQSLPITSGDTVIDVDTNYGDFKAGDSVFIYSELEGYEISTILSFTASSITTVDEIVNSYSSPMIMPIKRCYAGVKGGGNMTSNGSVEYDVNMRVSDNNNVTPATFPTTYKTFPVVTDGGFFAGRSQKRNYDSGAWAIDNQTGKFSNLEKWNIPKVSFEYGYSMQTPQECWEFRQFIHYLNGRQKAVWLPSLDHDFSLSRNVISSDTFLYLENDYYFKGYGGKNFTDHVAIYDGTTWFFREIISSGDISEEEEFIEIDSSLGTSYNIGELKIMRMPLCRLLSDEVDIKWTETGEADGSISFVEVEQ
jgi:hypothetical protein